MPIRDNLTNTYKLQAETETYVVADGITIGRGQLIRVITVNGVEQVTNVIGDDDLVDGATLHAASAGETVECYVFVYRTKYKDLELYPYVVLEQFTYDELRKKKLKNYVSTATSAVVNTPCNVLDQYSCDNLDKYGVRVLQKED